ncbi:hypothetical protein, partial [Methanoculleus chikugoensis]|uniref:WD40 repeat domain-containing protein n=1 Tax=Methanoculleus chikugoensis TaxID=118126 RepID=UPI001FB1ED85
MVAGTGGGGDRLPAPGRHRRMERERAGYGDRGCRRRSGGTTSPPEPWGGDVLLFDGNGGRYWTKSVAGSVRDLAFAGDGRSLAAAGDRIVLFTNLGKEEWTRAVQTGTRSGGDPPAARNVRRVHQRRQIHRRREQQRRHPLHEPGGKPDLGGGSPGGAVTAVDASRDGRSSPPGGRDRALQVYGRSGGLPPWALPTGAPILALALSGDGRFVVIGKEGGDVECYRPNDALLWTNRTGSTVLAVDVSRRGEAVAAGNAGGTVYLWNGNGNPRWTFDAGAPVSAVALSENGDYLAAGAGERAFIFRTADVPVTAAEG